MFLPNSYRNGHSLVLTETNILWVREELWGFNPFMLFLHSYPCLWVAQVSMDFVEFFAHNFGKSKKFLEFFWKYVVWSYSKPWL